MKTLSVKLPESLLERLDSAAMKRGESRSVLLREAIEMLTREESELRSGSCLEMAKDLAGSISGPEDLSFNKRNMEDYGK
jgi:metal-responsive CopG/Arc/MetJ family transcriptional regulator